MTRRIGFCCQWFHHDRTLKKKQLEEIERPMNTRSTTVRWLNEHKDEAEAIIEEYSKKNGYNFQHAENGGEYHIEELGYWVDAYDKEKNTVLEYDELHHNRQQDKDNKRQNEIINHIKCRFIRINENGEEILNTNISYGKPMTS